MNSASIRLRTAYAAAASPAGPPPMIISSCIARLLLHGVVRLRRGWDEAVVHERLRHIARRPDDRLRALVFCFIRGLAPRHALLLRLHRDSRRLTREDIPLVHRRQDVVWRQ